MASISPANPQALCTFAQQEIRHTISVWAANECSCDAQRDVLCRAVGLAINLSFSFRTELSSVVQEGRRGLVMAPLVLTCIALMYSNRSRSAPAPALGVMYLSLGAQQEGHHWVAHHPLISV